MAQSASRSDFAIAWLTQGVRRISLVDFSTSDPPTLEPRHAFLRRARRQAERFSLVVFRASPLSQLVPLWCASKGRQPQHRLCGVLSHPELRRSSNRPRTRPTQRPLREVRGAASLAPCGAEATC